MGKWISWKASTVSSQLFYVVWQSSSQRCEVLNVQSVWAAGEPEQAAVSHFGNSIRGSDFCARARMCLRLITAQCPSLQPARPWQEWGSRMFPLCLRGRMTLCIKLLLDVYFGAVSAQVESRRVCRDDGGGASIVRSFYFPQQHGRPLLLPQSLYLTVFL